MIDPRGLATFAAGAAAGAGIACWLNREKVQQHVQFTKVESVVVYGGSAVSVDEKFFEAAVQVGKGVAKRGWRQINGGGSFGMMGASTDGGLSEGGTVDAVILDKFIDGVHKGLRKVHVVPSMPSRKMGLYLEGDAFIALPGGLGTIEEIMEVLSWRQLGFHDKPVVFVNTNGFYTHLAKFIDDTINKGFASSKVRTCFHVSSSIEDCLEFIATYQPVHIDKSAIHQGNMQHTEAASAFAHGLPTLIDDNPTPVFVPGQRVIAVKPIRLQRTGEVTPGLHGTVTKYPGELENCVEVDFDDGPLADVPVVSVVPETSE
eukprot:TRINITY_DN1055_c0_g1_i1.p1 TRINITY_DN1055_c0_g1~~TRINITY_DN1055_c0_g1_i1.p1  ORF type:complete len:332 (+),score=40.16 TRINITY_DN1055_c0_g1_i1:48-998(+)